MAILPNLSTQGGIAIHMKKMLTATLVLMLLCALPACSGDGSEGGSGTATGTTGRPTIPQVPAYSTTDTAADAQTTVTDPELDTSATEAGTQAPATSESQDSDLTVSDTDPTTAAPDTDPLETAEPIRVDIPTGDATDLTPILRGEDKQYDISYSFANADLNEMRQDATLRFTLSGHMQEGEYGLQIPADRTAAVGISRPMSHSYTAWARMSATLPEDDSSPDATSAVMLGVRCTEAGHVYTDSGIWILLQGRTASVSLGNSGSPIPLTTELSSDTSQGISLRVEDEGSILRAYANDSLILTARFGEERVTIYNTQGRVVAESDLAYVATGDALGYVRVMSHQIDGCLTSLRAASEVELYDYTPHDGAVALKADRDYLFREGVQYRTAAPTLLVDGHFFADVQTLAELFDLTCRMQADGSALLSRERLTLTFRANNCSVTINGMETSFPTILSAEDTLLVCADWLADMLGYVTLTADSTLYILPDADVDAEAVMTELSDRYTRYEEFVYTTEEIEFDPSGVGLYEGTEAGDRLVGIAYHVGHILGQSWSGTDRPLNGAYTSDDREVIYRHGLELAAAGVDLVYVDWSGSTEGMVETATDLLFEVWSTIPGAPRICIQIGPGLAGGIGITSGDQQRQADRVYLKYVTAYPDLYFSYEGRPLLLCYAGTPSLLGTDPTWQDDRFTLRWTTDTIGSQPSLYDEEELSSPLYWGRRGTDTQVYTVRNGAVEAIACSGSYEGQSFGNGEILRSQFARADALGAHIVLLTDWNTWSDSSEDFEPSIEEGTFRYDLLCELIRQFKA